MNSKKETVLFIICCLLMAIMTLFASKCYSQTVSSVNTTMPYPTQEKCDTFIVWCNEAIDNGEMYEYRLDTIPALRNLLCDCFIIYKLRGAESRVVFKYFKNQSGYLLK